MQNTLDPDRADRDGYGATACARWAIAPSRTVTRVSQGHDEDEPPPTGAGASSPGRQQMPWPEGTTFGRADKICLALIVLTTLFGLAMLPARPVLLGLAPPALVAISGSRTGMVASGALAAVGQLPWWPLLLVVGIVSLVKFDPVYWWAGRLWGDWFIKSMVGPSAGAQKRAARAEALARKYDVIAIAITFIPFVPIPRVVVLAVLGASGTSLRRFLAIDVACGVVLQSFYLWLGFRLGAPAVAVLDELAKWSLWVALAIVVFVTVGAYRSARKEQAPQRRREEEAARERIARGLVEPAEGPGGRAPGDPEGPTRPGDTGRP